MPHNRSMSKIWDSGKGIIRCSCGQTLNYSSEREEKMKIRIHEKFCPIFMKNGTISEVSRSTNVKKPQQQRNIIRINLKNRRNFMNNIYPSG